jgi:D-3-phosphoglycerate dehydrogenase
LSARILIADKLANRAAEILGSSGHEVTTVTGMTEQELCHKIQGFDAIIVRSAVKVTKPVIDAADMLKVIGRAGTGVDNIDVPAATKKGVVVMNVPGGNSLSAAEHTLAMLFSVARMVPQADASLRRGEWQRSKFTGIEITGKTLGILGFGRVGQIVADRALGLKMRVLAFDPAVRSLFMESAGVEAANDLTALVSRSDFISLHMSGGAATKGIIGRDALAHCRPGAMLINCARGDIVDEAALAEALKEGRLAGAALDVFSSEPPIDSPLLGLPNVVMTPHLGASTLEAQERVAIAIAEQVRDFLDTGRRYGCVN